MKFCVSTDVGTWTNWSSFEPDPDHSPGAGTGKSESRRSVEVGQTGILLREILFTPRCSPRAREFSRVGSTFLYNVRLRSYGASNLPNFRILAFVGGTSAPPSALLVIARY